MKFQKTYLEDKQNEINEKKKNKGGKGANKAAAVAAKEESVKEVDDFKMPKGAVLKLSGLGGDITREDIKEVLKDNYQVNIDKDKGDVAFITYEKGEAEAKIRFKVEDFAKPIAEKWIACDKVEVKDMVVAGSLLEGEEEEKFLAESVQDLKNRRNKNRGHKRRGGFHGHGGKRGRR